MRFGRCSSMIIDILLGIYPKLGTVRGGADLELLRPHFLYRLTHMTVDSMMMAKNCQDSNLCW